MTKPIKHSHNTNQSKTRSTIVSQHYQGPIPPPAFIEKLEQIKPGLGERIVIMAEKESEHRRLMEKKITTSTTGVAVFSIFSAILCVVIIAALSAYAIYCGFGTAGALIATSIIVSLALAFIKGKKD